MMARMLLLNIVALLMSLAVLLPTASAHYDPVLGRWLERDPVGYVDGMNVYEYVRSKPVDGVDDYGLACNACADEDLEKRIEKCKDQDSIKRRLEEMKQRGCSVAIKVGDDTVCKGGIEKGKYCCGNTTIYVCPGADETDDDLCETIRHELSHAYDHCVGASICQAPAGQPCDNRRVWPSGIGCLAAYCSEARAMARSGECCKGGRRNRHGSMTQLQCIARALYTDYAGNVFPAQCTWKNNPDPKTGEALRLGIQRCAENASAANPCPGDVGGGGGRPGGGAGVDHRGGCP